jgi:hypothetical protein
VNKFKLPTLFLIIVLSFSLGGSKASAESPEDVQESLVTCIENTSQCWEIPRYWGSSILAKIRFYNDQTVGVFIDSQNNETLVRFRNMNELRKFLIRRMATDNDKRKNEVWYDMYYHQINEDAPEVVNSTSIRFY